MKESKTTIDDLVRIVQGVAQSVDDLAIMTKNGFDELHDEMDKRFDGVDQRFDGVDQRFDGVDQRFDGVERRLSNLERGQEEIKSVMGNAATKFEVRELDRRVTLLEEKAGMA